MKKKVAVRLPKIYSAGGDLSKKWFVFFSIVNPLTDKMERIRIQGRINSYGTEKERLECAYNLQSELKEKLLAGWNPLTNNEEVVYRDAIRYHGVENVIGKMATSTKNVRYYTSKYVELIEPTLQQKSLESYKSKYRIFCLWLESHGYGNYDITVIDNRIVLEFFKFLITDRKLCAKTVKKYQHNIHALFTWIKKQVFIKENPVYDVPRIVDNADFAARPIPQSYLATLQNAIRQTDPQLWLVAQMIYYCALRPGEIRQMKVGDIDATAGIVRVSAGWSKNKRTQSIAIPKQLLTYMNDDYNLFQYPAAHYLIGNNGIPGESMVGKNRLRINFNRIRTLLNLPPEYKLYSFKHTSAVKLAKSGRMSIRDIQQHFRHSSIDTTDKYMRKMAAYDTDMMVDEFPDL